MKYGASGTWGAGEAGVSGERRELKKELEGNGAVDGRVRMWAVDGRERVRVEESARGRGKGTSHARSESPPCRAAAYALRLSTRRAPAMFTIARAKLRGTGGRY